MARPFIRYSPFYKIKWREICDVVFKPLTSVDIGNQHFDAGQPVLYIDTAKTSSLEQAVSTVYAQGGQGNPRLIGWDGEKTLTFTLEDALMSPISFATLSGAGIVKGHKTEDASKHPIYVHATYDMVVEQTQDSKLVAKLTNEDRNGATLVVTREAPIYPVTLDSAGAQSQYLSAVTEKKSLPLVKRVLLQQLLLALMVKLAIRVKLLLSF